MFGVREFWTRERIVTHVVQSSAKCRSFYRLCSCRMTGGKLKELEDEALTATKDLSATGRRRTHAALPVVRVPGPLVGQAEEQGIDFYTLHLKEGRNHSVAEGDWPTSLHYR